MVQIKQYKILSFDYPNGTYLYNDDMIAYAKRVLKINKIKYGKDKNILVKDISNSETAWNYLKKNGFAMNIIEPELPDNRKLIKVVRDNRIVFSNGWQFGIDSLFDDTLEKVYPNDQVLYEDSKGIKRMIDGKGFINKDVGRKAEMLKFANKEIVVG
jgi:hypothetical protein